jgi:hypothetical protein
LAFAAAVLLPGAARANGADLPPEVELQAFLKQEQGRLLLLVRVPLDLLASFSLPKRPSGTLDLEHMDARLREVAAASAKQIELRADGVTLAPGVKAARISLPADRSFASYESAQAHIEGASLPPGTDIFWNQGFFDAELEYALPGGEPHLAVRVNVAPELGARLKVELEALLAQGVRRYVLPGGSGWIALDPRWYEALWLFLTAGFFAGLTLDRWLLFACLIAPLRRVRDALLLAAPFIVLQALALAAAALGALAGARLPQPVFQATAAAGILLLAIGNLAAPSVRVRLVVSALLGALAGFAVANALRAVWQFAGSHAFVSALSFDAAVALGALVTVVAAFVLLRWVADRLLGASLCVIVASALIGHAAWHWLGDRGHTLGHELEHANGADALHLVLWLLVALAPAVAGAAWLSGRLAGAPRIATLLGRLQRDSLD